MVVGSGVVAGDGADRPFRGSAELAGWSWSGGGEAAGTGYAARAPRAGNRRVHFRRLGPLW